MNQRLCPLCGSKEFDTIFRSRRSPGPLVKCRLCGFLFISPLEDAKALIEDGPVLSGQSSDLVSSSDLSNISQWEQSLIKSYMSEECAKRKNARSALERIHRLISPPGNMLDIGCFCGVFLDVAREAGWTCRGIEPLLGPSIFARGNFGLDIVTDTLGDNTFEQGCFDVVTSFQVFEHLVDPMHELHKIKRLLRPGGVLVLEVPNLSMFAARLFRGHHRHFVQDHINFFNRSTLAKALEANGFLPVDFWYPSRLMSMKHLMKWLSGNTSKSAEDDGLSQKSGSNAAFVKLNLRDIISVAARNVDT